ncbi:AraC family transcriptional regulator [Lachnoclostridium phytofermentans]|uniref:Transcriptional regulator, AraC family n=1 Tax=Lachnoclostridium phytofermentans (strain ATCC 700394 / DSM 18823 / ISDg) TaxID=357809 RepID=A9KQK7_LACP7|nr:helix-turn-helix domain-containing protein [Lachnoclostridium phytofermentans]ABX41920.1 transcriptional regulator, AraC family [Lachnoclostridium phytofermentans ISDg]
MSSISNSVYKYLGNTEKDGIIACGYITNPSNITQIEVKNPYYSCFIVLKGKGEYSDEFGRKYKLSPGKLVQRLPGIRHSIVINTNIQWKEYFISFGSSTYYALLSMGLLDPNFPVLDCVISEDTQNEFDELLSLLKHAENHMLFSISQQMQNCILNLLSNTQITTRQKRIISKAKDLLSSNLNVNYSEHDIADILGLGCENFRKTFKKDVGISPMVYRNQQRMYAAKTMLLSELTIAEIGERLGYTDAFTFSKQFKKHCGISPSVFKKENIKQVF